MKPDTPFSTTCKIPAKTITSSRSSMLFDDVVTAGTPVYRRRTYFPTALTESNTNLVLRTERRDNYFFKIKFVFFLYLLLSVS